MIQTKDIKLRMVFMGTSGFASVVLDSLIKSNYNIVATYTKPDAKQKGSRSLKKNEVRDIAQNSSIPVFQPKEFDEDRIDELKKLKPDIIIVVSYGKIIPQDILNIPGFGTINIHASLLPKYRGPSPIQNAIISGESETGITLIVVNEKLDAGDIISQKKVFIDPDETAEMLNRKLSNVGANELLRVLPIWLKRKINTVKQNESLATVCQLIERDDGKIIWNDSAANIYNKYRGLFPWPGIFSHWNNNDALIRIKFVKISLLSNNPKTKHQLAEVFQLGDKIGVQTAKGVILLEELQVSGKKPTKIEDFMNGYPNFIGSILK